MLSFDKIHSKQMHMHIIFFSTNALSVTAVSLVTMMSTALL